MSFETDYYNSKELGALAIALIGGLNWGLVGAFDVNLVEELLGAGTTEATIAYIVVGLAAVVVVADLALDTELLDQ